MYYKSWPLELHEHYSYIIPYIQKPVIGMESIKFVTSWYYSRVQSINRELWRVEVKKLVPMSVLSLPVSLLLVLLRTHCQEEAHRFVREEDVPGASQNGI